MKLIISKKFNSTSIFHEIYCLGWRGVTRSTRLFWTEVSPKVAEFSESTIFSNVLRRVGLFQNQLKSDDVSARVLTNAQLRSDERSASRGKKKISCFTFKSMETSPYRKSFFLRIQLLRRLIRYESRVFRSDCFFTRCPPIGLTPIDKG